MRWSLILFSFFLAVQQPVADPAYAGQDDPRLDPLFQSLAGAKDAHQARVIESRIWSLWLATGDRVVNSEMARGIALMNAGALQSALASFDRIIDGDPTFAEGWNKRATVYYMMGDLKRSVLDIERTVALEPRHFGAFSGLGLIYLTLGDDHAALRAFERALRIHPYYGDIENQVRRLRKKIKGEPA